MILHRKVRKKTFKNKIETEEVAEVVEAPVDSETEIEVMVVVAPEEATTEVVVVAIETIDTGTKVKKATSKGTTSMRRREKKTMRSLLVRSMSVLISFRN
jgi:hypothetical protein